MTGPPGLPDPPSPADRPIGISPAGSRKAATGGDPTPGRPRRGPDRRTRATLTASQVPPQDTGFPMLPGRNPQDKPGDRGSDPPDPLAPGSPPPGADQARWGRSVGHGGPRPAPG